MNLKEHLIKCNQNLLENALSKLRVRVKLLNLDIDTYKISITNTIVNGGLVLVSYQSQEKYVHSHYF